MSKTSAFPKDAWDAAHRFFQLRTDPEEYDAESRARYIGELRDWVELGFLDLEPLDSLRDLADEFGIRGHSRYALVSGLETVLRVALCYP